MSVDWSKYPTLPKPPKLPEWRDTPEHEAYWEEVEEIRTPFAKQKGLWRDVCSLDIICCNIQPLAVGK